MRQFTILILLLVLFADVKGQSPENVIRSIFDNALTDNSARENLHYLTKNTKGRLAGSDEALHAVEYTRWALIEAGADSVWLQAVPVPHWERGNESAVAYTDYENIDLTISALGLSVGTPAGGVDAEVVEVESFDDLKLLGKGGVSGKIVFFNRAADRTLINTFAGYSGVVGLRVDGASEAARYGALAVVVRSPTQAEHDFAHTGVVRYNEESGRIPAVTVSPYSADRLSLLLENNSVVRIKLVSECRNLPDTISYNVVGEIRGTSKPGEYITVGGHLDAWDITEGAHDDAGGGVQSIEVIRLFKELGIKPARSVRAVMFMNEEMTSTGGRVYADLAEKNGENHYAALESDRGVLSPVGFGFGASGSRLSKLVDLQKYFSPYGIVQFTQGGGGSDISPLRKLGTLQIGYIPETQRYFWFHHSANDTFEQVNIREMQLGSAAIASLIYLIDLYDL